MPCADQMTHFSGRIYSTFPLHFKITSFYSIAFACQKMITSAHHNATAALWFLQPHLSVFSKSVCAITTNTYVQHAKHIHALICPYKPLRDVIQLTHSPLKSVTFPPAFWCGFLYDASSLFPTDEVG